MTDYIEDPYIRSESDDFFNNWFEIEGTNKIRELSRQLRTFFNYKAEVIRYRFRPRLNLVEKDTNTKFFSKKQEIESLTHEFIALLKPFKKNEQTLEQGIHTLFFDNNNTRLNKLSEISEKLCILVHYFSEESIQDHPNFLKFIVILAQNICSVKKCLNAHFSEFYEELEINYNNLEGELEDLIETTLNKQKKSKKQLEERLTS